VSRSRCDDDAPAAPFWQQQQQQQISASNPAALGWETDAATIAAES